MINSVGYIRPTDLPIKIIVVSLPSLTTGLYIDLGKNLSLLMHKPPPQKKNGMMMRYINTTPTLIILTLKHVAQSPKY